MVKNALTLIMSLVFLLSMAAASATFVQVASATTVAAGGCGDACNYADSGACAGQMCSSCKWYDPDLQHECQKPSY